MNLIFGLVESNLKFEQACARQKEINFGFVTKHTAVFSKRRKTD